MLKLRATTGEAVDVPDGSGGERDRIVRRDSENSLRRWIMEVEEDAIIGGGDGIEHFPSYLRSACIDGANVMGDDAALELRWIVEDHRTNHIAWKLLVIGGP